MKIPRLELDAKKFYLIGKYAFFITGVIGLIRVVDLWSELKSYDIFSSLANTVFTFTLFLFFAHLQGKEDIKEVNDEDIFKMNEALNKLDLGGKK
jgi:multisubunit Na+/H+ antiporter MnhG subunit